MRLWQTGVAGLEASLVELRAAREVPRGINETGEQIVAMSVTVLPLERRVIVALDLSEHGFRLTLWITDTERRTSE